MRIEEVIGERIREVRDLQELTQEQFGLRLGELLGRAWSRQAVSSAEQGGRQFTAAELVAIAHVLNTTVPRLLTPPLTAREIELPSGAKLDREPLTRVVFPKVSAVQAVDHARESMRMLVEAVASQHTYFDITLKALDVLQQNLTIAVELTADEASKVTKEGVSDGSR